jgi:hypothetical protein
MAAHLVEVIASADTLAMRRLPVCFVVTLLWSAPLTATPNYHPLPARGAQSQRTISSSKAVVSSPMSVTLGGCGAACVAARVRSALAPRCDLCGAGMFAATATLLGGATGAPMSKSIANSPNLCAEVPCMFPRFSASRPAKIMTSFADCRMVLKVSVPTRLAAR